MRALALFILMAGSAAAESVVATRAIRPQQVLTAADIRIEPTVVEGAFTDPNAVIGKEALFAIYPGRAVMRGAVSEPAVIERNQAVELIFKRGGLRIAAEGRSLGRGAVGQRIRVMNESSRTVLFGTIAANGTIVVSN